jgi:hypothetical protein
MSWTAEEARVAVADGIARALPDLEVLTSRVEEDDVLISSPCLTDQAADLACAGRHATTPVMTSLGTLTWRGSTCRS